TCLLSPATYDAPSGPAVGEHNSGMTRRFLSSVVLAASFAGALTAAAQQPAPAPPADPQATQPPLTFRVEANFVEVDAFVSDATGKPITELRPTDFQVLEDGKPQMVSAFSYVNIPIALADRHRARRGYQRRHGRPHLPVRARRPARGPDARPARQGGAAPLLRAELRRQRSRRRRLHRRALGRRPGVHEQHAPAAGGGGQVHGPQDALADARA